MHLLLALLACKTSLGELPPLDVECTPSDRSPARGVVGLSDPHTLEPVVVDLVEEAGAPWVRAELHWSVIQPEKGGPYDFQPYDDMVQAYRDRDIEVLLILTYVPDAYERDWEAIDEDFRAFATAAVQRYAPMGVHYYEVFNEPNLPGYGWLTDDDDAWTNLTNYTRLLDIANEAVRDEDPEGFVVLGGIASEQHRGLTLDETMSALLGQYEAQDCFDVMTFHPYGFQNQFADAADLVDGVMSDYDADDKPVWFNEYGWTDYESMDLSVNDTVSTNPMLAAFDQRDEADGLFWFSAKDYSGRASAPTFGLADYEGRKRPSFDTFRKLMDEL